MSEVITVSDAFRFETFVDVHGNIFNEYLSSVVARLSKEDEEYKALQEKIEGIYEEYPKVLAVFDSETKSELTEKKTALAWSWCRFLHSREVEKFISLWYNLGKNMKADETNEQNIR